MNTFTATVSKWFVLVPSSGLLAAALAVVTSAAAQMPPPPPPPPEFIATTEPAYYEGHAAYWYNGHWFWRDEHGAWNHYDREPPFLADRRAHFPPARRSWHGRR